MFLSPSRPSFSQPFQDEPLVERFFCAWTQGGYRKALRRIATMLDRAFLDMTNMPHVAHQWRVQGPQEFSGLVCGHRQWLLACNSLSRYFWIASNTKEPTLLPSALADSVWHAWLAVDPGGLEQFQRKYFGRVIAHVEKATMTEKKTDTGQALARTWAMACKMDRVPYYDHSSMPLLFRSDAQAKLPSGWHYAWQNGGVHVNGVLNSHISRASLLAVGITMMELQRTDHRDGGADAPVGTASGCGSCDSSSSGCSDGGGSSCGSGCGGGCGD